MTPTARATSGGPLAALVIVSLLPVSPVRADVPPRTESGAALVVPESQAALGRVYHVRYPADSAQVTFASEAPLERIVGRSNRVVGYVVAEMADEGPTGRLLAGAFRLPVGSLDSGHPMRDDHLRSPFFLDAESHPEITFEIGSSTRTGEGSRSDDTTAYDLELHGRLTIKGTSRELSMPARVAFTPQSQDTRVVGPGDALALTCAYRVDRAEYSLGGGFQTPDLSDAIEIEQFLMLTTVSFDERVEGDERAGVRKQLQKFLVLARDLRDAAAGYAHGRTFMERHWEDAEALNELAMSVTTEPGLARRDLAFAMKAARRARELTGGNAPHILDTVALIHYEQGDLAGAVTWQRQAFAHLPEDDRPGEIGATLRRYETEAGETVTVPEEKILDLRLAETELAVYQGRYRLEPDDERGEPIIVEITAADGRLQAMFGEFGPVSLLGQGDHEFRPEFRKAVKLIFEVDGKQARALHFDEGNDTAVAQRIDDGGQK